MKSLNNRTALALVVLVAFVASVTLILSQRPAQASQAGLTIELTKEMAANLAGDIAKLLPSTWPHSSSDIINVRGRAIAATEEEDFDQSVGTSTLNIMGNSASGGAAEASYDADVSQMFRIVNYHASNKLCLKTVARSASTVTCNTTCTGLSAGTLTCAAGGGVTTGGYMLTSSMPPFSITIKGTECLCVEADAASTTINAMRVSRSPNQ